MKKIKKIFAFTLALIIALSCFCISVSAVESDAPDDNGNMELDVVFVLDSSGSMAESDPNRVAPDAFKLFVDLCDESCGVGYTIYSEKIKDSENITALDQKHLEELRGKIAQMNTNPYGDTDIALGLAKAFEIHKASENFDSKRKKVVILLSDGNTHLIDNSKSPEQLKQEMDAALTSLSENEIPVYAIGLNYDGTLDKNETQNIADKTHGKAYETKSSNELPGIISDIFADIYSINGSQKEIKKDGSVEIYIKDKSVFYVNIVIRSRLSIDELNPTLFNPRRENIPLDGKDKNIKMTNTGSYTLIKLIYPTNGRWKLHLDNATNENCIVTQLDFYSIFVKQKISDLDNTIVLGQETQIEATLNKTDSVINDHDLIDDISMTATIIGGKEPMKVELERQGVSFMGKFIINEEGTYKIITEATSEKFRKESLPLELQAKKYTDEEIAQLRAKTAVDTHIDVDASLPTSENAVDYVLWIAAFLGLIVLIIAAVIIFLKVKERNENAALSQLSAEPDDAHKNYNTAPKESAPVVEKVKEGPKPVDPDYVDIPIVEHGSLESLIKKGPDEAFNANADDYKVDESLEAIIRKGPDNNLGVGKAPEEDYNDFDNTQDEGYQSGNNLSEMFGGLDNEGSVKLNKKNNNN